MNRIETGEEFNYFYIHQHTHTTVDVTGTILSEGTQTVLASGRFRNPDEELSPTGQSLAELVPLAGTPSRDPSSLSRSPRPIYPGDEREEAFLSIAGIVRNVCSAVWQCCCKKTDGAPDGERTPTAGELNIRKAELTKRLREKSLMLNRLRELTEQPTPFIDYERTSEASLENSFLQSRMQAQIIEIEKDIRSLREEIKHH
jgi:hypothetical protein